VPNEIAAGEQYYINTVVAPGFLGIPPIFVGGGLPQGGVGATIYFGPPANLLSTNMISVTPAADPGAPFGQPPGTPPGSGTRPRPGSQSTEIDDNANALANAVNQTGVQTLNNPCVWAGWIGAAVVVAAGGAAVANAGAIGLAVYENLPVWATSGLTMFFRWVSNPGGPPILSGAVSTGIQGATAVGHACGAANP